MEIGAVFLDVDGTLISFRTHEVPRSAVEALRAAHARGVRLFIATGRAASDLEQLSEIPYDGVVSLNGARCLTADGRVVSQRLIPRLVAHPVPAETDLGRLFDRGDCCQMCFYCTPEQERRVMAELPSLVSSRWCPLFVDVNVRGVDKATGMLAFASDCGVPAGALMAIGDGGNDVPMLRAAGVGVAMGNGCGEALAAADWVTASVDDDGIRKALEHFGVI